MEEIKNRMDHRLTALETEMIKSTRIGRRSDELRQFERNLVFQPEGTNKELADITNHGRMDESLTNHGRMDESRTNHGRTEESRTNHGRTDESGTNHGRTDGLTSDQVRM